MSTGVMLFNRFTGKPRDPRDIASDPQGLLVWDGEEPLRPAALATQRQAEPVVLCSCKDRPATKCPGEWEPGCDLGNNPKHARPVNVFTYEANTLHIDGAQQPQADEVTDAQRLDWLSANPACTITEEDGKWYVGDFEDLDADGPYDHLRQAIDAAMQKDTK